MRIVFLDRSTMGSAINLTKPSFPHEWIDYDRTRPEQVVERLRGATLGVIGEGAIGQAVARLGQAFGMRVLFAAHKNMDGWGPLYTPFDEVLQTADVITLHCPLTPQTRNMIAAAEFAKMQKRPVLINCARGGIVNEFDLVQALKDGQISGLGFDCLTSEPPASGNPLREVLEYPNVIVTPHVAWGSDQAMQSVWTQVIEHIENFRKGSPTNCIA